MALKRFIIKYDSASHGKTRYFLNTLGDSEVTGKEGQKVTIKKPQFSYEAKDAFKFETETLAQRAKMILEMVGYKGLIVEEVNAAPHLTVVK